MLADRTVPNNEVGRQLLELVSALPDLASNSFADSFASSVKDLLMVIIYFCIYTSILIFEKKD